MKIGWVRAQGDDRINTPWYYVVYKILLHRILSSIVPTIPCERPRASVCTVVCVYGKVNLGSSKPSVETLTHEDPSLLEPWLDSVEIPNAFETRKVFTKVHSRSRPTVPLTNDLTRLRYRIPKTRIFDDGKVSTRFRFTHVDDPLVLLSCRGAFDSHPQPSTQSICFYSGIL